MTETVLNPSKSRRFGLRTVLPVLLFILVLCLNICTTWYTSGHILDSDASSELVLAQHLNEIGKPLSSEWYYSTEIRVLNTQLIYAPLFSLFSDWHMVRFTGALILQTILLLSFLYLSRQARLGAGAFFLGASLLLLPVSVTYGRNTLYQTFYIPHISISFMSVGLTLSSLRLNAQRRRAAAFIRLALLMLLAMGSGMGGPRQAIATYAPLLFLVLLLFWQDAKTYSVLQAAKTHSCSAVIACAAILAFLAGYLVNIRYLDSHYIFADYHNLVFDIVEAERFPDLIYGLLHTFGFRQDVRVLSVLGILTAGAVFSFLCCISRGICLLIDRQCDSKPERRLLPLFFLSAVFVSLCVYVFIDGPWLYQLHILPASVWFIPLVAAYYDAAPVHPSHIKRSDICMALSLVLLLANGFANSVYFNTSGRIFAQKYDGQYFGDIRLVQKMEKPVAFLQENGYEHGYAEVWPSSVITEMTDGAIKVVPLMVYQMGRPLVHNEWLMLQSTLDMEADKTFLMLVAEYNDVYLEMDIEDKGELIYQDNEYVIYHFDDPSILREYTSW